MRIVVSEFLTLDGVMQAPGGEDEDRSGGFEHGGWQLRNEYIDDIAGQAIMESFDSSAGMLLGRKTYDIFAGYWPTSDEEPIATTMNTTKKYVASRTLTSPLEWQNSTLLEGDTVQAVRALKDEPGGDLFVIGSGDFAQTLIDNDLVDEYRLMIHPIVVGGGKRLFRDGNPLAKLTLVDSKISGTGVAILTYRPK
ncbi:MAG: dihydrofolate reductase family protein [Actinomycetota bacterium]